MNTILQSYSNNNNNNKKKRTTTLTPPPPPTHRLSIRTTMMPIATVRCTLCVLPLREPHIISPPLPSAPTLTLTLTTPPLRSSPRHALVRTRSAPRQPPPHFFALTPHYNSYPKPAFVFFSSFKLSVSFFFHPFFSISIRIRRKMVAVARVSLCAREATGFLRQATGLWSSFGKVSLSTPPSLPIPFPRVK